MSKILLIVSIGIVLIGVIAGCGGKRVETAVAPEGGGSVRIYEVLGMDCPGCHGGLEKLVLKISAVFSAQASWKEQQLVVIVKPGLTLDDELVYDAIRRANFTPGKRLQ